LFVPTKEEWVGAADYEARHLKLDQACEDRIELAFDARMEDMELQTKGARRRLYCSRLGLSHRTGWIDKKSHDFRRGHKLMQQFQPLRQNLCAQLDSARDIAPRLAQVSDQAELDWVAAGGKDDRNGRSCGLCSKCRGGAGRGNDGYLTMDEISRHGRQALVMTLRQWYSILTFWPSTKPVSFNP